MSPRGAAPPVLVLAPLAGDADALERVLAELGFAARACADDEELAVALEAAPEEALFVVVTHEGATERVGRALVAAHDAEPGWSSLPVVFLVSGTVRPPPACRPLDRANGQPSVIRLERPASVDTLRAVFAVQAQLRRRQFNNRDLLRRLAEAERHQRFLLNELQHRTRNSLTVLQGMFHLTARQYTDLDSFAAVFSGRLQSLVRAHSRLSEEASQQCDLARLLREHITPYCISEDQLRLGGPKVHLQERMAFDLALVVHELATNASKYGALSADGGRVRVDWEAEAGAGRLRLMWAESGGPPTAPPSSEGLGSRLIQKFGDGIGGSSAAEFRPQGLVWTATIPPARFALVNGA